MRYAELTFSLKIRLLVILQLCLGLFCFLWMAGYPFMGAYYTTQKEMLLLETVMGESEILKRIDPAKAAAFENKYQYNQEQFRQLSPAIQSKLEAALDARAHFLHSSFSYKLKLGIQQLFSISPFELLWILAAVIIPILLLLRWKWALLAVWCLPLLTVGYVVQNRAHGLSLNSVQMPSESELLRGSMTGTIQEQIAELENAWQNYLIRTYAGVEPTADKTEFANQLLKAEFAYNLAEIDAFPPSLDATLNERKSWSIWLAYLIWNFAFALLISLRVKVEEFIPQKYNSTAAPAK